MMVIRLIANERQVCAAAVNYNANDFLVYRLVHTNRKTLGLWGVEPPLTDLQAGVSDTYQLQLS